MGSCPHRQAWRPRPSRPAGRRNPRRRRKHALHLSGPACARPRMRWKRRAAPAAAPPRAAPAGMGSRPRRRENYWCPGGPTDHRPLPPTCTSAPCRIQRSYAPFRTQSWRQHAAAGAPRPEASAGKGSRPRLSAFSTSLSGRAARSHLRPNCTADPPGTEPLCAHRRRLSAQCRRPAGCPPAAAPVGTGTPRHPWACALYRCAQAGRTRLLPSYRACRARSLPRCGRHPPLSGRSSSERMP
mmetsp:Transcript_65560/g.185964  ORF Transcript_65560/g.185964 Transcript_65560/m.185964 type:complete len:241 (+) Transcript_65560:1827-2549(+)